LRRLFADTSLVPTTPGLHTRAALAGTVTLANRTVQFAANCFDGPSASQFPEFQVSDGPVQSIAVSVVTTLENDKQQVVAQNHCTVETRNGFLTARCVASEASGGEVDILVSIASLPVQVTSDGVQP
jgi:hypothetical protein